VRILRYIDKLSGFLGIVGAPLSIILAGVIFYDVAARYFFNAPTFWAYEVSWMLYSANFLLGLAYALREGAHVRVDIILHLFPTRLRSGFEAFFLLTTLFVLCAAVVGYGIDYAVESWKIREAHSYTMWAPPVYHIKAIIVVSFFVLGLQGLAEFIRKIKLMVS
jgi:TRAP-type mannitol/chloroaromatic compound transport system permease small subunit